MKKSIYIFNSGEFHRKDNTLEFSSAEGKKYIPVEQTSEIYIFGEVDINKRLLDFCSQQEIILHFYNYHGYYSGTFYPREHRNSGYMTVEQARNYINEDDRLYLAQIIVKGATDNIVQVMKYYLNRDKNLIDCIERIHDFQNGISSTRTINELMACEGNIRETYYSAFDEILQNPDFVFERRSKRPPENRLNSLISFGNTLLYTACLSEIYKTHLDPRIGVLHQSNFRRFSLNLDIAEIFKPIIIDRMIFSLINKKMITKKHFDKSMNSIIMSVSGRKIFLKEFDERLRATIQHKRLNRNVSYRTLIKMECHKLEKHFIGEAEYQPFLSKW